MEPLSLSTPGTGFWSGTEVRRVLEEEVLPKYVPECRWFGGKARQPQRFAVEDLLPLSGKEGDARLALIGVGYAEGSPETYLLPLQVTAQAIPHGTIASFNDGTYLTDALQDEKFRADLLHLIAEGGTLSGAEGELCGLTGSALPPEARNGLSSRVLKVEQSNSALVFGDHLFMKLFRKLEEGLNPDVEITRYLSEERSFKNIPAFGGALEYRRPGREAQVLAVALGMVSNQGDAWATALREAEAFLRRLSPEEADTEPSIPPLFGPEEGTERLRELAGDFTARVQQLAERTAETHLALAAETPQAAFAPEPLTQGDQASLAEGIHRLAEQVFTLLPGRAGDPKVDELLRRQGEIGALTERLGQREIATVKTRTHGDFHLGQVLDTGGDFVIIDFEGEPQRSLEERKQKRSPLRDVAGMLRSFHYAAHSALSTVRDERLDLWAEAWAALMSRTFLQTWLQKCAGAAFLPPEEADLRLILEAYLLEKAIYEINYELNNRPAWLPIPVQGVLRILG